MTLELIKELLSANNGRMRRRDSDSELVEVE